MLENFLHKSLIEAGCDEAGRGCLAGPVFAAAVIWPHNVPPKEIDDSKKLNKSKRLQIRSYIEENALAYAVKSIDQLIIDEINILNASIRAMHKAISALRVEPQFLLIDGNRFLTFQAIPHECIIKGDGIFTSIAAASILAKTYRDEYMEKLHENYPHYGWDSNKGYPTKKHRQAIKKYGITRYHRKSFKLL